MEYITLNNGIQIPKLGFGTMLQTGKLCTDNVAYALNNGYTLIDTANRYGNEVEVGKGLKASHKDRSDYLIETKLGPTLYENEEAIEDTLKRLGVDYIDIMVLHHPVNNYIYAYHMLEKAYKEGKVKAIGICNFSCEQIEELIKQSTIIPQIMQVECHPYYPAEHLIEISKKYNIVIQAWYPLGHGNTDLLNDPLIVSLADKYHKSPAQIILRWHTQKNFALVPGSKSHDHILDNINIFDFRISDEDMSKIEGINRHDPFYHQTKEGLQRLATTKCNFED